MLNIAQETCKIITLEERKKMSRRPQRYVAEWSVLYDGVMLCRVVSPHYDDSIAEKYGAQGNENLLGTNG
ncbi:hypothetical protein F7725_005117 [Dissostichus mawsoni]|uniref:Uncharacterized protein n=1 Tax=Dissostichus mawsoni TaxID=36200 RepID=A0A7J5YQB7_DISMA|nr:hypothetical protein F7725_005117 [Dissostichus mawsoni]